MQSSGKSNSKFRGKLRANSGWGMNVVQKCPYKIPRPRFLICRASRRDLYDLYDLTSDENVMHDLCNDVCLTWLCTGHVLSSLTSGYSVMCVISLWTCLCPTESEIFVFKCNYSSLCLNVRNRDRKRILERGGVELADGRVGTSVNYYTEARAANSSIVYYIISV